MKDYKIKEGCKLDFYQDVNSQLSHFKNLLTLAGY